MKTPTAPSDLFALFVDTHFDGNQSKAADALGVDRSMVSRICKGERGVTPEAALKVEQISNGAFRKEAFIWPEQDAA